MTYTYDPSVFLKYANLQMAAEAFLVDGIGTPFTGSDYLTALTNGNGHASRFPDALAADFADHWSVVAQKPNTTSGFSGTLFKNIDTGELVLSFRSTEFIDDAACDNQATNTLEVKEKGWAFGQIADMEAWYKTLTVDGVALSQKQFSVTGYSLGGHLATAFNLLRQEEAAKNGTTNPISGSYIFNGAGVGLAAVNQSHAANETIWSIAA